MKWIPFVFSLLIPSFACAEGVDSFVGGYRVNGFPSSKGIDRSYGNAFSMDDRCTKFDSIGWLKILPGTYQVWIEYRDGKQPSPLLDFFGASGNELKVQRERAVEDSYGAIDRPTQTYTKSVKRITIEKIGQEYELSFFASYYEKFTRPNSRWVSNFEPIIEDRECSYKVRFVKEF